MMRRYFSIILAMVVLVGFSACPGKKDVDPKAAPLPPKKVPVLSGPKKRVGVFEFDNKSRYGRNRLSNAAVDVLYTELQKSNAFVLYERSSLDQLGREFDLINSGRINLDTAAEAGKMVGVQAVVVGTISQFGIWEEAKDYGVYKKKVEIAEATIDVRVVDVTTGRIIFADTGTGRTEREMETVLGFGAKATFDETMADKALRAAMAKFMDNLIQQVMNLPWEGYVMDVEGDVIYINAGRSSGMANGQVLTVKRVTGKLTDPVTGEFKGYKTTALGTARVYDLTGEDVSVARMIQGSGAKRGDLVVLGQ